MLKRISFIFFIMIGLISYSQTYFPFKKNEKWGVFNKNNKTVFMTEFDSIAPFSQYYNEGFTDKHPFSIAFASDYKKIINYKGEVLLDSLLSAKEIGNDLPDLLLKTYLILPYYKFSKSNPELFGYFFPEKQQIIVPDVYNQVHFYFDNEYNMYYYGYNPKEGVLDIFDVTGETLLESITCDSYKFDNESEFYNDFKKDSPEALFLIVSKDRQKSILDFKGNELIPKGLYKNIQILSKQIIIDDNVYDLKGNFIEKVNLKNATEDEEYVGFKTLERSTYEDYKLTDLGNNTLYIKKLDLEFKVKKKWKDIKLFFNERHSEKLQYIRYSHKGRFGIYDFINENTILKPKYKSIVLDFHEVDNNYPFFDQLPKDRYHGKRSMQLFSIQNKKGKYNFFDPIKEKFIFKSWFESIALLNNYDHITFQNYFIVKDENTFMLYDLNGKLVLNNIKYLSIGNEYFTSFDDSHKVSWFKNKLLLDRYIYIIFKSGNSGYIYIDNKNWKLNSLYPAN